MLLLENQDGAASVTTMYQQSNLMQVIVPAGAYGGQPLMIQTPSGQQMQVVVPAGLLLLQSY